MRFFVFFASCLLLFFIQPAIHSQLPVDRIEELCNAYSNADRFSGVILVGHRGAILYEKAFGLADRELNVPVREDMKFRIGSLSKPFTAILILQLMEEGKLSLEGHITDYLPEYRGDRGDEITIRELLNHTSGIIQSLEPETEAIEERLYHSLPEMVRMAEPSELYFDPGTGFHYSNFGYRILALIAERLGGTPFDSLLAEKIFQPLDMVDTRQNDALAIEPGLVKGYEYRLLKGYENASFIDPSYATGAGGLVSTADDLLLFDQALYEGTLVSESSYRDMTTPSRYASYGLGWELEKLTLPAGQDTVRILSHSGSINGFGSYMARIERDSLFVVVLKNFHSNTYLAPSYAPQIGREIISLLYGEPVGLPEKSIAVEIGRILGTEGTEKAIEAYHRIRRTDSISYNFGEPELNRLGIELLFRFEMPREALDIFELNMHQYPCSYNTYDSYAYALRQLGDYPNSIRYYDMGLKVLEKCPEYNRDGSVLNDAEKARESIEEMKLMLRGRGTLQNSP